MTFLIGKLCIRKSKVYLFLKNIFNETRIGTTRVLVTLFTSDLPSESTFAIAKCRIFFFLTLTLRNILNKIRIRITRNLITLLTSDLPSEAPFAVAKCRNFLYVYIVCTGKKIEL